MLFLLVFAVIAFVIFFKRAGKLGEPRKAFWGGSGAAAVIAPATVVSVIAAVVESLWEYPPEGFHVAIRILGVLCLVFGVLLGKWMLDRFLPLPKHFLEAEDDEVPEDD